MFKFLIQNKPNKENTILKYFRQRTTKSSMKYFVATFSLEKKQNQKYNVTCINNGKENAN